MKSRISIALGAFNMPVIKIEYCASDDVRDVLVKQFLEGFGDDSCYARFGYHELPSIHQYNGQPNSHAELSPICARDLPELLEELKPKAECHLKLRGDNSQNTDLETAPVPTK